ncbi:MAG: carbohydrate transporter permease [Glaciihabitans sp.]|jgi:multiple sugar transport system permease protein|nr:carbohydrate transporter permease [Glaciihabitans sp.]MDQ1570066.1 multiple sugar transport system permease protein [Actinomycetota bacterium]
MLSLRAGRLGRNILFIAAILFFGVPIIWLLLAPTKSLNQLDFNFPLSFGSFGQIGIAANNLFGYGGGLIWTWMLNSVWYTVLSVVLALVTSVPAGYALAKLPFRGSNTILFVTLVTMIVPAAALILPLYLEMSAVGLTNTPWSVILPLTFYPFGVYMIYLFTINSIPSSIIEAARLDGASEFGIMMRIFLPLARPAVVMIAFFAIVGSWNSFFLPFIMLTSQNLATLQTGLQILVSSTGAIGGGNLSNIPIRAPEVALAAIISILPILLVFIFAQRYLAAGQSAGAEKG